MSLRLQLGSRGTAANFSGSGSGAVLRGAGAAGKVASLAVEAPAAGAAAGSVGAELAALGRLGGASFGELSLEYDSRFKALWCLQNHSQRPNFTNALIRDISSAQSMIRAAFLERPETDVMPVRYVVWASGKKNIFNLGGDLIHFVELLEARDRAGMESYARSCIKICYQNYINLDLPIVSIALVEGDALGGGLESALSSDLIVAEKSAQFGFPEILFGLFPGMGAYTYLYRRVGARMAEQMILSGRIYRGEQLYEMGLVDVLAPDGEGEATLYSYLSKNDKRFSAHRAVYDLRRRSFAVKQEEMLAIGDRWVDAAMGLGERDIKKMRRLAKAQLERLNRQELKNKKRGGKTGAAAAMPMPKKVPDDEPAGGNGAVQSNGKVAAARAAASAVRFADAHSEGRSDGESGAAENAGEGPRQAKSSILNFSRTPIKTNFLFAAEEGKMESPSFGTDQGSSSSAEETPQQAGIASGAGEETVSGPTVYEKLLEAVAEARAAATLQPGVERLLSEGMDREEYLDFLEQLYHVVWHFCPTMAAAAGRCEDDKRQLRFALYQNIADEKGHESWVLDDISAIGGDAAAVAAGKPVVPVRAMIGYNYYVAERKNPWAVLGMVHVLEEISANYAGRVAEMVAKRLGVTDGRGFRFLGSHGTMDVSHVNGFKTLVEHIATEEDFESLVDAVEVNYALFGALFRDA